MTEWQTKHVFEAGGLTVLERYENRGCLSLSGCDFAVSQSWAGYHTSFERGDSGLPAGMKIRSVVQLIGILWSYFGFLRGLWKRLNILVCHSVTPRSRAVHFHSYERGHPKLPYEVWKVEFIHRLQSYRTCLNLNTSSLVCSLLFDVCIAQWRCHTIGRTPTATRLPLWVVCGQEPSVLFVTKMLSTVLCLTTHASSYWGPYIKDVRTGRGEGVAQKQT